MRKRYPTLLALTAILLVLGCAGNQPSIREVIIEQDRERIITAADSLLQEAPETVTAHAAQRSAGGLHDFYSEGDYWWPDPENPDGPYIRRDGMSNPDNFTTHRKAMVRFSVITSTLTAAWVVSGEERYGAGAIRHLRAWFVNPETRINPHLKFAQAIKGRVTGRGVGIIDTIHLVEVARSVGILRRGGLLNEADDAAIADWFRQYLHWMTTHEYGIDERERKNNHGTCWVMQVAAFAGLLRDEAMLDYCRERYKTVLLPNQVAADGSFPRELARTKPYGYSLFNLDAMATVCHMLSDDEHDLWNYQTGDGRSLKQALEFMVPFIRDKDAWPYQPDVMYFDEWPIRHPALIFAANGLQRYDYLALWKTLPAIPVSREGFRNFPIRQPVLWFD